MAWQRHDGKAFTHDRPVYVRFRNRKIAGTHAGHTVLPASKWNGLWNNGPDWPFDIVATYPAD